MRYYYAVAINNGPSTRVLYPARNHGCLKWYPWIGASLTGREHGCAPSTPAHGPCSRVIKNDFLYGCSVHTTRVYGPCRHTAFTGSVDRRPLTRPVNKGVRNNTTVGHPCSRPVNTGSTCTDPKDGLRLHKAINESSEITCQRHNVCAGS